MMYLLKRIGLICALCACFSAVHAMHMIMPYKVFFQPTYPADKDMQVMVRNESGFSTRGYNYDGVKVRPLYIWNCNQDALAMLDGAPADSPIGQLRTLVDAHDDGVRGHVLPCGKLRVTDALYAAFRYVCGYGISAGLYVPFYAMHLHDVGFVDLTKDVNQEDARVKQYLTGPLVQQACTLGDLYIGPWRRSGIGDILLLAEWNYHFEQRKPFLKDVNIDARLGFTLPTGKRQDEDKWLAVPFGYDGACALFAAGGLTLNLGGRFFAGFDVELHKIFGHTKMRRIKTALTQTDLLFLQKACAYKEYGLEQQFTLFAQISDIFDHLSVKLGYQFFKHNDDHLSLLTMDFSNDVANSAPSLWEYTTHTVLAQVACDIKSDLCPCTTIAWFAAVPCNGRRSLASAYSGLSFAFEF